MLCDILTGMLNLKYEAWINMHEYVCMDDHIYATTIIAIHVHEDIACHGCECMVRIGTGLGVTGTRLWVKNCVWY